MSLRYAKMMAHYRSNVEVGPEALRMAEKSLLKLYKAVELNQSAKVPLCVLEPLINDVNTPQVLAALHGLRKNKRGKELFASMRMLGFIPGGQGPDDYRMWPEEEQTSEDVGFETAASV